MSSTTLGVFNKLVNQPHGIVLVTGPTGSGKTTTLYAALGQLDNTTTNILIAIDGEVAHTESHILAFARMKKDGEKFDTLTLARVVDRMERRDGVWRIAARRLAWEWNHEMPMAESWGRGLLAPDPTVLVRGAKHPHDIVYTS